MLYVFPPGDAVFFHSNVLHCSPPNESDHKRWAMICSFNKNRNNTRLIVQCCMFFLPGAAVFSHSNVLHCSPPNESDHKRWTMICSFNKNRNNTRLIVQCCMFSFQVMQCSSTATCYTVALLTRVTTNDGLSSVPSTRRRTTRSRNITAPRITPYRK